MLETIIGLLFLGSIVFVATTGESSTDKKQDEKQDEKDENEVSLNETTSYNHKPAVEQKNSKSTPPPPPEP
ncbi:hypothetical protein [Ferrovum sp.]|uniref:hypothetical protein n=1 Tax=Ferrovum sp. TaxID=2609467 RepID=UPI00261AC259|nr:hypothetical protein [Ferrovum sp.]